MRSTTQKASEFDPLVPSQFFAMLGSRAPMQKGEYRLLIAVLQDAVACFQKYAITGDRHFAEVEHWLMHTNASPDGDTHAPRFSFEFICAALDIDANYLRGGLRSWREATVQQSSPESPAGC